MRKKLSATGTSGPAALETLEHVRTGKATVGRKTVPILTNVGTNARELHRQLGVATPKVSDVADLGSRHTPWRLPASWAGSARRRVSVYSKEPSPAATAGRAS